MRENEAVNLSSIYNNPHKCVKAEAMSLQAHPQKWMYRRDEEMKARRENFETNMLNSNIGKR